MKAPHPKIKLLPVSHPLGRKASRQAVCYHGRLAIYPILYNNVHYGEPRLHYEVAKVARGAGWELGFHCEATDKHLNRLLLDGFRRHLFEIKDTLGNSIEAEMWDHGWTKIYEVVPEEELTTAYQLKLGQRLAEIIICLNPFFVDLRNSAAALYR